MAGLKTTLLNGDVPAGVEKKSQYLAPPSELIELIPAVVVPKKQHR